MRLPPPIDCALRVWTCFLDSAGSCVRSFVKNCVSLSRAMKTTATGSNRWKARVLIGSFQTRLEERKCPNKSQKRAVLSNLLMWFKWLFVLSWELSSSSALTIAPFFFFFTWQYNYDWHFSSECLWLFGEKSICSVPRLRASLIDL